MKANHDNLPPARRPVRRRSILKALMASSALIAAGVAGAQAQTWNVDANGNWGTAGNWNPASVPNSFNATANLGAAITADRTITLDAPISLNTLNFQNPAHSYTIAPLSGAGMLTFDGGFSANLNSTATAGQTIGADVVLNKYLNANIGAGGDVTIAGGVSGSGGLTKTGAGVLTLSGPGAYTGSTNINAGTLRAGAANAFAPASFTTMAAGATLDINGFNQAIGGLSGAGTILLGDANLTISNLNATFSGQISGDGGSLTSANSGSLRTVLTGDNSYTGGTRVSSGQLQVGNFGMAGAIVGPATIDSGALLILHCNDAGQGGGCNGSTGGSGTFGGTITNNGTLATQGGGTLTFSGAISGAGMLAPTQGLVVLTANNSYSGGTFASNGGKLQVGAGGTTGSMGTGEVNASALTFNRSNELIVDNLISGGGTVTQAGSGLTILTANNTYTGGTTVNAGSTLQIGNGGTTGAWGSGQSVNNGTLIFNRSNDYSVDQYISNAGTIVNAGAGATTLNGKIVGSGSVATTAGTLILNGSNNDFSGGATIAAGSTLKAGVTGGTAALGTGNIINSGALVLENSALYYGGAISGAGSVTQLGGKTYLTGTSTYTGGTTVSGGILQVGYTNSVGSITGNATIASGGALLFFCGNGCNGTGTFDGTITNNGTLSLEGGSGALKLSGAITGAGKVMSDRADLVLTADNSYAGGTESTSGKLQVGDGGTTGNFGTGDVSFTNLVFNRSNELIVGNRLSGGTVSQIGSGTTILTADNTYTGGTTVNAGSTLQIGNGGTTGAWGSGQSVNNGTLIFNRSNDYSVNQYISNAGVITNAGTGVTTLNGAIVGAGSVSTTAGTLILNSSLNDFSGGATIAAGSTLEIGNYGNPGSGNIQNDGTLVLDRDGPLTYAGMISGAGVVRQSGVGGSILAGNNSYSGGTIIDPNRQLGVNVGGTLGSGSVQNGGMLSFSAGSSLQTQTIPNTITGAGSIDKREAGTTVLTADNNYTGGTSLFQGKLQLGNGGTSGGIANTANVDLQYRPAFGYTTLAFNRSDRVVFDAPITGGGKVAQDGAGTTVLIKDNTYTGGTTISAGGLQVGDGGTTGALGSGPVTNAAALTFNRSNAFGFNGAITNSGVVTQAGPGATTLGGTISGAGSVTTTAGTLILTANNTYAGGTTITAGTLQLGNGGATGMIAGNVSTGADGVLAFNRSNSLTFGGLISGEGKVIQDGANANVVTELTANNTYSGGTEIKAGTLYVGAIGARGSTTGALGTGPVINDAKLTFNRRNAYSFDGAIANNGVMTKAGEGTTTLGGSISGAGSVSLDVGKLILTADNTYTGPTTIDYRTTLQLGDGGAAGTLGSGAVVDNGVLTINRTGVFEISGVISGYGSLNKMGFGTAILSANNTYTDGTTIEGGTLQLGNGGTTGTIIGNLTNKGVLSFNRSDTLVFDGLIKGGGRVTQDGPGKTVLTANNEYFGDTIITAGTLQLGDGGATGSINSDVINYGTLSFNHTGDNSSWVNDFWGAISGTGRVTQDGANTTRLIGDNTYTGGTIITAGGLQLGDGGETGSIVGDVINNAELSFNRSNTLTFDGTISGTGRVVQKGDGTTILSADNSYSGGTLISAGTLQIGNGGASGTLGSGPVVDDSVLAINRSGFFEIPGVISGVGRLDQMGPGTTILTGNNTYSGGTTISGGALQLGDGGTTGSVAGDVANDGTLSFNHSNRLLFGGLITGAGKVSQDGAGVTSLTANNAYTGGTFISAGTLQLGDGGTTGSIVGDVINNSALSFYRSNTLIFGGAISGTGRVTQDGVGTTILTSDNSYSGGTLISAGTLQIGNGGTSGTLGFGPVVDNSVLAINRSGVFEIPGVISGVGRLDQMGPGTTILTGDNTYSGGTTISGGALQLGNGGSTGSIAGDVTNDGTLSFNHSNRLVFGGLITGAGKVTQDGSGVTALTANNLYFGDTTITAGTLQLGDGGTTGAILNTAKVDVRESGALSFNRSDRVVFDRFITGSGKVTQDGAGVTSLTANNAYTGGTFISTGTLQLGDGGTTGSIVGDVINNSALSFYRSNTLIFGGAISGTGRVTQDGVGTTILTSDNSYSGGTLISAGTLQIGNGGASGTLGSGPVVDDSVLAINRSGVFEIPGVISGVGRLDQMGPGTTILTGDNSYSGGTTISGGALQLGNGGSTGSIAGDVANNGTLSFNRSNRLVFGGLITGAGKVSQDGSGVTALTANNLYFGDTTITAGTLQLGDGGTTGAILNTAKVDVRESGALSFNRSDRVVFDRFITGGGKVRQDGAGVMALTADNDYTGGTLISAGVLQIGNGGTTGSIVGDAINNSALSFYRSNTLIFGGAISGTGKVTQDGVGTTILTSDNSYSGGTLISAGTLQIGNGGASGTLGSGPVVDDSVLAINRSGFFEIPGVISGVGRLDQMGPGTTILTGDNSYSGGTTISGGALQLGNGGTTGWILGDVANNGTLIFNRSDAVTFSPTISGAGGVIQMGSGSTNLTATNSYTGPTLVQAGKLSINGSITSDTTVSPGATLGGNGTIFGSVVNYGVVAPGNSIGQLNIVGSYTQAAGSFYQVELNPAGQADRIMVSGAPGAATIQGGTVAVQAVNGVYPLTYKYTIVTATGGVTGKYAGLTTDLAFLRPMITYDANNVYLEASVNTPTVDYTCGATTANQNAVATALNQADGAAAGDFANVIGSLFGLNNNQGSAALDAMSGQPYSGFGTANIFNASLFGSALRQQMVLGRQGATDGNRTTIKTADGAPSRLSTWVSGIGGTRTVDGGASAGSSRVCGGWTPGRTAGQVFNAAGLMGGVDYRVDPSTLVGLSVGGAGGNDWTKGFNGRGESDSVTVATYADFTSGAAYADLLAGYVNNTNRMTRQIAIPGLRQRTAHGSTGAPQWFGQAEVGYRFGLDQAAMSTLTPFTRLEATTIAQRGFTEWGAEGLNLAVAGQRTSSLRTVLGAEFTTAYKLGWQEPLGLQLRAGHAHDHADMTRPVTAAFAAAPWARYTLQGAAPPRDSATVGLRLWTMLAEGYWPFLRYDGDIARGADSHAINAGLRIHW